ncbi:MAG: cytochrome c [Steroidobacter sp.]
MTLNRLLCSAVIVAALIPAVVATAEPTAKELQHARHEHYEELGDAFKVVRDQTRASSPDLAAIKTAAKKVNDASVNQEQWFKTGTGPEAGKTGAKAEIWSNPAEFKAAMKLFSDAAPKLHTAADAGDVAAIKTAFGDVGKSCKNCHDKFRIDHHKKD